MCLPMNNHKALCRELSYFYKNRGICAKCGAAWADAGHTLCKPCAKKARDQEKRKDPSGELKRQRMHELRERRKALGLCFQCGKPTDGVHAQCRDCLEKGRERELLRRIKKRLRKEVECNEKTAMPT